MNQKRKKDIQILISQLNMCSKKLNNITYDEEDYYDNIPDNLQDSIRANESSDAIDYLENASEKLLDAIKFLNLI